VEWLSTSQAATMLGTTPPTIRALLAAGTLRGRAVPRGQRWRWSIERLTVEAHLSEHGRYDENRVTRRVGRLQELEDEVAVLRELVRNGRVDVGADEDVVRERDDLRAAVVSLEEVLARTRVAVELQRDADTERASIVEHLLAAVAAGERADALRRQAQTNLEEALASFTAPGHAVRVTSPNR